MYGIKFKESSYILYRWYHKTLGDQILDTLALEKSDSAVKRKFVWSVNRKCLRMRMRVQFYVCLSSD